MKTLYKRNKLVRRFLFFRGKMKEFFAILSLIVILVACNNYLDIVPDNVATLDDAFTSRTEAEKYLFTCYSYLPNAGNPPYFLGGDEIWVTTSINAKRAYGYYNALEIAQGNQGTESPYLNFWDGLNDGVDLFQGIRVCNIFLEKINNPNTARDLKTDERSRWIGEAEFLKAYYHFILLRMYGPIPIVDKNIDVAASPEEVRVFREPVDSCVNYIAALLDTAAAKLPDFIVKTTTEAGRVTKSAALSIKARMLLMAASPLFNGNIDYQNFVDKRGIYLFNSTYDATKWVRARDAAKEAIDAAEVAGASLYYFTNSPYSFSDTTMTQMSIRNAVCERWNSEKIWAAPNTIMDWMQTGTICNIYKKFYSDYEPGNEEYNPNGHIYASMRMAELFYTKNGVPINEDKTLDFTQENALRVSTHAERYYIEEGYQTARLNFDREPRFYADLGFDGGNWVMYDTPSLSDENPYVVKAKFTQYSNNSNYDKYCASGYFIKKIGHWKTQYTPNRVIYNYPWPIVRLADVYLMYAEASNEVSGPNADIYSYLDLIRQRAGIPSVEESWTNYSSNPEKYKTQDGLREIIRQERLIELAFEKSRFWDLRRWKLANEYENKPILGWSVKEETAESYYKKTRIGQPVFVAPRDYFWPIREYEITVNPNLVQNPNW